MNTIGPTPYCANELSPGHSQSQGRVQLLEVELPAALSDDAIHTLVDCYARCPSPMSQVLLEHLHGAAVRVGAGETALAWVRETFAAMQPFNYLDDDLSGDPVAAAYGSNYAVAVDQEDVRSRELLPHEPEHQAGALGNRPDALSGVEMDLATVNKLLTTTRSVRARLDLTRPVPPELIEECLEIAVQAPQGSSLCRYHFIVVTDPAKRGALADLYRKSFAEFYPPERLAERRKAEPRDVASWTSLAEHFQDIPVLIIACVEGRPEGLLPERLAGLYGNILPITWSLMLALRSRGVGAAWTTIVFSYEKEVAELLQIPANMTPAALLPVAYFRGDDFKPAQRVPARERTHWNTWGSRR